MYPTLKSIFLLLLTFSLLLAACDPPSDMPPTTAPPPTGGAGETATVLDIIDGDTIDVQFTDGREERVRYIGVNTPERGEPCYAEATRANAALVKEQTVTLIKDTSETDKNGRLLRYVFAGNVFVNAELVRQGYAEAKRYPPDVAFAEDFETLEDEARLANRACHATGIFGGHTPAGEPVFCEGEAVCIKGNINQQGEQYYHFPGCGSYDKTQINESNGERWFNNSPEAEAAGWVRAPDCP